MTPYNKKRFCPTWVVDRLFNCDPISKVFTQLARVVRQDDVVGLVAGREGKTGRLGLLFVEGGRVDLRLARDLADDL